MASKYITCFAVQVVGVFMSRVSLEDVYSEVKRVNMRLRSLEKALEVLVDMVLPEEEVSEKEWGEIKEIEAEIERGECVSLEDVRRKYRG